jgi:hypothetical protein
MWMPGGTNSQFRKRIRCLWKTRGLHEIDLHSNRCRHCKQPWLLLYPSLDAESEVVAGAATPRDPLPDVRPEGVTDESRRAQTHRPPRHFVIWRGLTGLSTAYLACYDFIRRSPTHLTAGRLAIWALIRSVPTTVPALVRRTGVATRRHRVSRLSVFKPSISGRAISLFLCGLGAGGLVVWLMGSLQDRSAAPGVTSDAPRAAAAVLATAFERRAVPSETARVRASASVASARSVSAQATASVAETNRASVVAPPPRQRAALQGRVAPFYGALAVRSIPEGALVSINGQSIGTTPLILTNQRVGARAVRVALDGYEVWTSSVRVVADQQTNVIATLQRAPQ